MPSKAPTLHVRLPAALAEQVRRLADEQGVSLNTMLVALISRATAEYPVADAQEANPKMTTVNNFPTQFKNGDRIVYIVRSNSELVAYHSGDDCCDSIELSKGFEGVLEAEAQQRGLHRCKGYGGRAGFDAARA
jgi:hypothetical protein